MCESNSKINEYNPYKKLLVYGTSNKTAFYLASEDLRDKLTGAHIEAIADIVLLCEIYKKVILLFPDERIEKPNDLFLKSIEKSNKIEFTAIQKNKSLISKLLLAEGRASYKEIIKLIEKGNNFHIFICCHRNLLAQLMIFKKYGSKNIFFKSQGSIFLHNMDNIYAILRARCKDPLFLKRFLSACFYLFSEHLSYLLSEKIFMMRHKDNIRMNLFGKIYHKVYGEKSIYSACGSYYFFRNKPIKKNLNIIENQIVIGSLGDNTFPTAINGIENLLKEIDKANKRINLKLTIRIAGKYNKNSFKFLKKQKFKSNINIKILGYIDDRDKFTNDLNGMLLAVSGGSGMPIKAIESLINYQGPIYVTKYIKDSCSGFFKKNKNIYYSAEEFLLYLKNYH